MYRYIEDYHSVYYDSIYRLSFYGVYDGHSGSRAARIVSRYLHRYYIAALHYITGNGKGQNYDLSKVSNNDDNSVDLINITEYFTCTDTYTDNSSIKSNNDVNGNDDDDVDNSINSEKGDYYTAFLNDTRIYHINRQIPYSQYIPHITLASNLSDSFTTATTTDLSLPKPPLHLYTSSDAVQVYNTPVYITPSQANHTHVYSYNITLSDALDALSLAYHLTDEHILFRASATDEKTATTEKSGVSEKSSTSEKSGTTAVTAILTDEYVLIGNAGDSRAILCCNEDGKPIILTTDHVADNTDEAERVLKSGGSITYQGRERGSDKMARVDGMLAVTRSIGDYAYKPYVISYPDVLVFKRSVLHINNYTDDIYNTTYTSSSDSSNSTYSEDTNICMKYRNLLIQHLILSYHRKGQNYDHSFFLVLISDGVYEVLNTQEMCNIICLHFYTTLLHTINMKGHNSDLSDLPDDDTDILSGGGGGGMYDEAAKLVAYEAYARGSRDNIGVCVINTLQRFEHV